MEVRENKTCKQWQAYIQGKGMEGREKGENRAKEKGVFRKKRDKERKDEGQTREGVQEGKNGDEEKKRDE